MKTGQPCINQQRDSLFSPSVLPWIERNDELTQKQVHISGLAAIEGGLGLGPVMSGRGRWESSAANLVVDETRFRAGKHRFDGN